MGLGTLRRARGGLPVRRAGLIPSRYIYTITAPLGALLKLDTAWSFIDLSFAMMAAPNLIALILLSPVVFRTTRERLRGGAPLVPASEVA